MGGRGAHLPRGVSCGPEDAAESRRRPRLKRRRRESGVSAEHTYRLLSVLSWRGNSPQASGGAHSTREVPFGPGDAKESRRRPKVRKGRRGSGVSRETRRKRGENQNRSGWKMGGRGAHLPRGAPCGPEDAAESRRRPRLKRGRGECGVSREPRRKRRKRRRNHSRGKGVGSPRGERGSGDRSRKAKLWVARLILPNLLRRRRSLRLRVGAGRLGSGKAWGRS